MTEQEIKRLNRQTLLELLLEVSRENEKLRAELADRSLRMAQSGSIAEAALRVNGVFDAAEQAARQYLEAMEGRHAESVVRCEQLEAEARERAESIVAEAEKRAAEIIRIAEMDADRRWDELNGRLDRLMEENRSLAEQFAGKRAGKWRR